MNLPKLNHEELLMDCSVVENFIRREGKRERGVIFPLSVLPKEQELIPEY
jgi:hypothetical protein